MIKAALTRFFERIPCRQTRRTEFGNLQPTRQDARRGAQRPLRPDPRVLPVARR